VEPTGQSRVAHLNRPAMRFLCLTWMLLAAGCGSHATPATPAVRHSRVSIAEPQRNLWSFQRVRTLKTADGRTSQVNAHVTRQLQPGEGVDFENGTSVSYDGIALRVANEPLDSLNAVVNRDGTLRKGVFIRTFR
jgi:hypothetical protein